MTSLTPVELKKEYENLTVLVPYETKGSLEEQFHVVEGIKVDSYLLGQLKYWGRRNLTEKQKATWDRFKKGHFNYRKRLSRWQRKNLGSYGDYNSTGVNACFSGRGQPQDFEDALAMAAMAGMCKATKSSMQRFCDKRMGLDCSGFVSVYYQRVGKLPGRKSHNAKQFYDNKYKLIEKLEDVRMGDCLVWVNKYGRPLPGVGHIAMANGPVVGRASGSSKLYMVESWGGRGLDEGFYTRFKEYSRGGETYFWVSPQRGRSRARVKIIRPFA